MNQTRLIQPEDLSTQEIFSMENLTNACRQVRRNNGAAGVDGVKARELPVCPGEYWEQLREQILDRSYKPLPAKRTDIPKPDGSMRGLNVPAARDRVVQACLASYLDYRKDFEMSNSSYGFRKNRRCEQAILKGLEFMNDGYDWIVDIDLRKFFDTVDQDRLIRLIDNLFHNRDVTSLTRKFVRAGVMIDGRLVRTERGIPQGGPLSPVLANIYLDQADKELESRGLRFTRYADDMLIYVKSEAAANRVMKSFSNYLEKKLKLEVNASKSKVARPDEVKYLGFGFKRNKREWKAIPHEKSIHEFEQKIMKLTKRNWSVSLEERIEKINQVIRGWSNYFRCAWLYKETVRKLDSKLRRRIRAIIWKQWKSIRKKEESLVRLGCPRDKAHSYACARQGYVRCATTFLNKYIRNIHLKKKGLLTIEEYFDTVAERFMKSFVRTAQCRTARWVV
ncbi:group II intron reverse transcriptase/maturase [Faecalibaculum rodentium]|uniref:group II intron reverse transcriptase/maturase n=1 Tax=Faecalibaculum rodentium TaxID=1702221 RepID=UPI0034E4CB81